MIDKATAKAIANVIQSEIKILRTDFDDAVETLTVDLELKLQVMTDRLASIKDGTDGLPGTDGDNGTDGRDGLPGRDGIKGDGGDQGLPGLDGIDGEKGEAGTQGIRGRKGVKGEKGDKGNDGVGVEDFLIEKGILVVVLTDGTVKKLDLMEKHDDD